MAQKTCPVCCGTGSHLETQRIPNPAGGMFQEIEVRKPCSYCGGTGTVWCPDADPYSNGGSQSYHAVSGTRAKKDMDEIVAEWLFIGVWALIAYVGISRLKLEWYWPVGVGFVVGLGVYKLLMKRYRKALKVISFLFGITIIGATVLFYWYMFKQ